MLPCVLLHVIEPARPVHRALDRLDRDRGGQQVRDAVALVHDVHYRGPAQKPPVSNGWPPDVG